jgi:pilus assembly protein CpaC
LIPGVKQRSIQTTNQANVLEVKAMQINSKKVAGKKSRRNKTVVIVLSAGLAVLAVVRGTTAELADQAPTTSVAGTKVVTDLITEGITDGKLTLAVNKTAVITTKTPIKRVVIGQPDVIRDNEIGPSTILLTALKPGSTQLIIWDDSDRTQAVDVKVEFDLQALQDQYKTMFPGSAIKVATLNGAITLTGRVPSLQVADQAAKLAEPFGKVLNFLEISGGQQVSLAVKFAEVSRSATSHLGVNLGFSDGTSFGGSNIGQVNPLGILTVGANEAALSIVTPNPAVTLFGKGMLGQTAFAYFVDALRQNNLLRVLAEPNLTATSGQEASFLAGGEFPIPVTQGGGTGAGGSAVTIEYREFGVKLRMTPIVLGDGKIRLRVAPEVSDLDFTTAVRFNGFVVPGLTSRKLETVVELNEGQTFALAGLLNNNVTATKDVTPVLGDIPVVGALFRSVRYQRKETELVVLVTPKLVEAMNPAQVPAVPGENWREPNEVELFLNQDIGGPIGPVMGSGTHPAPLYHGTHGYSLEAESAPKKAD